MLRARPLNKNVAVLGATLAMTVIATSAQASLCPITVAWDANPESFVTGYYVYVRTNGARHEEVFNVPAATSYSYLAAVQGLRYDISVAAYTAAGVTGPRSSEVSTVLADTCDGETPDPGHDVHVAGEYRSRADLDAPVESLASLNDGRVLAVEGGRAVRVVDANGAVEAPALVADATQRFTEAMPDASSRRANAVLVGIIDTTGDGTREFSIVRYREVENTLGEGATVIAGLALSSDEEPRFTVDPNGWIYVAMPAARDGRADPYAGRILRFDEQGSVPEGATPRSPVIADGFAAPSGLFSDGRRLWAAGRDGRWPGSLAMVALDDAERREWPRTLVAFAIDPESSGERVVVALAGRRRADGQVVLGTADDRGALSILRWNADGTRSTESRELGTSLRPAAIAFGPDDRVIVAAGTGGTRIAIVESAAKTPRE